MKRIFLLLITAIAFGASAMAQDSRVATLHHGSLFKTYYGADALGAAHNDASDGDVVTLSAGQFNCPGMSKAITVRGEGMNVTVLKKSDMSFSIPKNSPYSLCFEGLTLHEESGYDSRQRIHFYSDGGSATVVISKCNIMSSYNIGFSNCNALVLNSTLQSKTKGNGNSSVTCINSILTSLEGRTFDVQNCVITQKPEVTNSSIKNSIIYEKYSLDNSNTTSHCLVKEGSSGFADSWYIKTEQPEPDPWGETPTYTLWNDLFTNNYHLTAEAAQTYIGTDGTEVGIYGGAYPYDETPDYPLVKSIDVKGIHNDGKLSVDIKVE